ncbi:hypothetical protein B0H15DRAFT_855410 [Mycena belliarum]|uniref:DUF6534 domain-containing protein n=1 Tax=Mycena belliarum TaxID=1033014 RepID=A0AAD6XQR8_9AGAR|nr:hypothetical protein B0H15DRAFT_855410 [Mycena belliae]
MTDIAWTLGALLIGGSVGLVLSGVVAVQCILFFKLYPNETWFQRSMVLLVWLLDALHSAFIVASFFRYFIHFFGDRSRGDYIPWSVALTVVVTAAQTLIFHWYFAAKIYKSSGKIWWIVAPIVLLAFLRLFAASVSTVEMIRLQRFSAFNERYPGWIFTTGLSLSASVDILITTFLCYFLQKMRRRTASTTMAHVVDTLTLYTLENGFLTCVTTTASLICWLAMPKNLVFMGLHFVIGKLYATSLLTSLNTRKHLRALRHRRPASTTQWDDPVLTAADFTVPCTTYPYTDPASTLTTSLSVPPPASAYRPASKGNPRLLPAHLEVRVARTVARASADVAQLQPDQYGRMYHQANAHAPRPDVRERARERERKGSGVRREREHSKSRSRSRSRSPGDAWRSLP